MTRASTRLKTRAGASTFSLRWRAPGSASGVVMRVEIMSGRLLIARGSPKRLRLTPPIVVRSVLRKSSVRPSASAVVSVSGSPNGTQTIVLSRGARTPTVGGVLVLSASPKAPAGLLGVVTGIQHLAGGETRLTTTPATLDQAYSTFHVHVDTGVGELLAGAAGTATAHAAAGGQADPLFNCDSSAGHSVSTHVDLSKLHVVLDVQDIPPLPPSIQFLVTGTPSFKLDLEFSGKIGCTAEATIPIPIADTGLVVDIGPHFEFNADAKLGAHFTWEPQITFGFVRGPGTGTETHYFHSSGSVSFTGEANLELYFALKADITLAGRLGIGGTFGPDFTGHVESQTATQNTCLTVDGALRADLTAFAHVLFKNFTFQLGSWTFGTTQLYHGCTNASGGSGGSGGSGSGGTGGSSGSGGSGGGGGATATQVAAGAAHTCALLTGGSIDCWGENQYGQLGDGTSTGPETCFWMSDASCSRHPVMVSGIRNATQIAAGDAHTCALLTGGSVDCWGLNEDGELGDGTTTNSDVPVAVGGVSNATQIAAGGDHTCALLTGGSVDCWGWNANGELGDGTHTGPSTCGPLSLACSTTPVAVSGMSNATQIAAGGDHTCALLTGASVDCWGLNDFGQLGDGTTTNSDVPVPMSGMSNATQVAGGYGHTCALLTGGSIDCSGWNGSGQLGDGTTTDSSTPVPVSRIG
jgi:hypothetical protein